MKRNQSEERMSLYEVLDTVRQYYYRFTEHAIDDDQAEMLYGITPRDASKRDRIGAVVHALKFVGYDLQSESDVRLHEKFAADPERVFDLAKDKVRSVVEHDMPVRSHRRPGMGLEELHTFA